jgi:hypothetical protein
VTDKVPPAIRSALSKFGAYTRRRDKSSLRYKPFGVSAPLGKPPYVHQGSFKRTSKKNGTVKIQAASPLRELTLFAYDPEHRSVVIGPAEFRSPLGPGVVPAIVEQRHPHTLPAFDAEKGGAAGEFKNLIR